MILISNNLQQHMAIPDDAVIRINMAWIKTLQNLEDLVARNAFRKIFLDFPQGRSKPPRPNLALTDAYWIMNTYEIEYFAVSNIEKVEDVLKIQSNLRPVTEFVPKIETENGVMNLDKLISQCNIKTIMLDKEDLFVDVEQDNTEFYKDIQLVRQICSERKVTLLELQGVTFIGDDRGTTKS